MVGTFEADVRFEEADAQYKYKPPKNRYFDLKLKIFSEIIGFRIFNVIKCGKVQTNTPSCSNDLYLHIPLTDQLKRVNKMIASA